MKRRQPTEVDYSWWDKDSKNFSLVNWFFSYEQGHWVQKIRSKKVIPREMYDV
jgi:hypothetical protein